MEIVEIQKGPVMIMEPRGRIDTGGAKPFDPLAAPPPDFAVPARGRKPGGLGIHFMRSLMDQVAHVRRDGINRLRLSKHFTTA